MLNGLRLLSNNSSGLISTASRISRAGATVGFFSGYNSVAYDAAHTQGPYSLLAGGLCTRTNFAITTGAERSLFRCFGVPSLSHRKFFFMKPTKAKGLLSYRGQRNPRSSWKKANYRTKSMYKLKT